MLCKKRQIAGWRTAHRRDIEENLNEENKAARARVGKLPNNTQCFSWIGLANPIPSFPELYFTLFPYAIRDCPKFV